MIRRSPQEGVEIPWGDALHQIQDEVGLSQEILLEVVASSIRQAWLDEVGLQADVTVRLDQGTGRLMLAMARMDAVGPADAPTDGSSGGAEAQLDQGHLSDLPPEVSRRAARLARASLGRWIKEVRERQLQGEAEEHRGQLADAIVERLDQGTWYLRSGSLQAVLAPVEQIPGERLRRGQHLKVVLMEARRAGGGEYVQVRASRTSPLLLRRLMEAEVPELADGTLLVRAVAREPGDRAKVAVESQRPEIDAKGACIGLRGVRIRAVVGQLGGEKVDVLEWSADPAAFVARALAPAPVRSVTIDDEAHRATVMVAPDVLSLAIGKEGQNARLAARLTGWRIDIRSTERLEPAGAG